MLRAALALLSTVQVGARIKDSFERSLRRAAVIAIAAMLLVTAAVFGLIAAYHALVSVYYFGPAGAAAIMAAGLLLAGFIALAHRKRNGSWANAHTIQPSSRAL